MRRAVASGALILMLTVVCASATQRGGEAEPAQAGTSSTADYVGTWSGTWAGAGTGGFVLTLEKGEGGRLGGRVSVTGEPTYEAVLKTVSFDGNKMTASYDFPPDPNMGVVLTATFEEATATGTWALRQSGAAADVAAGTWTVKRK